MLMINVMIGYAKLITANSRCPSLPKKYVSTMPANIMSIMLMVMGTPRRISVAGIASCKRLGLDDSAID